MTETLQENPEQRLSELEAVIERAQKSTLEAGKALLEIRDNKLYEYSEGNYSTFEDYCRIKWNYGKSRAYQLIDSYNVFNVIKIRRDEKMSTAVDKKPPLEQIYTGGNSRPISRIYNSQSLTREERDEKVFEAWDLSETKANEEGKSAPTQKISQQIVEEVCPEITTESSHPYRIVTYLNTKFYNLLKAAIGEDKKLEGEKDTSEKEADYLRRMVEYCLLNNIKV